jgi:hypothetical protein
MPIPFLFLVSNKSMHAFGKNHGKHPALRSKTMSDDGSQSSKNQAMLTLTLNAE